MCVYALCIADAFKTAYRNAGCWATGRYRLLAVSAPRDDATIHWWLSLVFISILTVLATYSRAHSIAPVTYRHTATCPQAECTVKCLFNTFTALYWCSSAAVESSPASLSAVITGQQQRQTAEVSAAGEEGSDSGHQYWSVCMWGGREENTGLNRQRLSSEELENTMNDTIPYCMQTFNARSTIDRSQLTISTLKFNENVNWNRKWRTLDNNGEENPQTAQLKTKNCVYPVSAYFVLPRFCGCTRPVQ